VPVMFRVLFGMFMLIMSPFSTMAMGPPAMASGEAWPIAGPLVAPENLPSVIRAVVLLSFSLLAMASVT